jgi:hypothetical protein
MRTVTTINGWTAPGFEGVREAFQANFDDGLEAGAAFGAYHRGLKVVDLWGGVWPTRRPVGHGTRTPSCWCTRPPRGSPPCVPTGWRSRD